MGNQYGDVQSEIMWPSTKLEDTWDQPWLISTTCLAVGTHAELPNVGSSGHENIYFQKVKGRTSHLPQTRHHIHNSTRHAFTHFCSIVMNATRTLCALMLIDLILHTHILINWMLTCTIMRVARAMAHCLLNLSLSIRSKHSRFRTMCMHFM